MLKVHVLYMDYIILLLLCDEMSVWRSPYVVD